jgi:hypothetical protein
MHKTAMRAAFEAIKVPVKSTRNLGPLCQSIIRSMERGHGLIHPRQFHRGG